MSNSSAEMLFRRIGYEPCRSTSQKVANAAGFIALGLFAGAAVVAFSTPKTGQQLRDQVRRRAGQLKDDVEHKAGQLRDGVEQKVGQLRDGVEQKAGEVRDAAEMARNNVNNPLHKRV